jgi:hypothetical protein
MRIASLDSRSTSAALAAWEKKERGGEGEETFREKFQFSQK